jgi:uncharacterized protein YeaO (DUF488 family)
VEKYVIRIKIKRAYDPPARGDGLRVLVDRLWPRGVKKEELELDAWAKELAPSTALRKWFGHDPARWNDFRKRYRAELKVNRPADVMRKLLIEKPRAKTITLLYGAKDREHNDAVVLRDVLERALNRAGSAAGRRARAD